MKDTIERNKFLFLSENCPLIQAIFFLLAVELKNTQCQIHTDDSAHSVPLNPVKVYHFKGEKSDFFSKNGRKKTDIPS